MTSPSNNYAHYFRLPSMTADRILFGGLLLIVISLVIYPILLMLGNSFIEGHLEPVQSWSLSAWKQAFDEPAILISIWNTIKIVLVVEIISMPSAILLAWLIARTDMPGGGKFEFMFWIAFFVPVLSATLGWVILLDPQTGLINQLFKALPFVEKAPFDIYSFWGIIWTHLATNAIAVKVMLLAPVFRNIDFNLEEASRVSGAGRLYTVWRVVLPLALPGIVTVLVLATIRGMQTFEIEQILGAPTNFWVFGTLIYRLVDLEPPQFGPATVLATLVLLVITPLIFFHRWLIRRKDYATIAGRMSYERMTLGIMRWPVFAMVLMLILVLVILPIACLFAATFMKLFGFFNIPDPWTINHWRQVLGDGFFIKAFTNTLKVAGASAIISTFVCTLIAYFVIRSNHRARDILDFGSWLPFALPGILFGVGILYAVLSNPLLKQLYGTIAILVIAVVIAHLTLGVQILKATMLQLTSALEEAARVSGASWWYAFRQIILPIILPTLILVAMLSFVAAARDVATIAVLGSNETKTLSLLQLDYLIDGRSESAAVVSMILAIITTGTAFLARIFLGAKHMGGTA